MGKQGTSCPSCTPRCSTASPVLSILTSCVSGLVRPGAFVSLPRGSGARYYFKLGTGKIVCSRIYMVSPHGLFSLYFAIIEDICQCVLNKECKKLKKMANNFTICLLLKFICIATSFSGPRNVMSWMPSFINFDEQELLGHVRNFPAMCTQFIP